MARWPAACGCKRDAGKGKGALGRAGGGGESGGAGAAREGRGAAHRAGHEGERRAVFVRVQDESIEQVSGQAFPDDEHAATAQFKADGPWPVKPRARMREAVEKRCAGWAAGPRDRHCELRCVGEARLEAC